MAEDFARQEGNEAVWRQILVDGHPLLIKKRGRYGLLPGDPRCKLCTAPFRGIGGWVMRRIGLVPSKRNPRFCNMCDVFMKTYPGGAEVPVTLMFADIRNSVGLSARMEPREVARLASALREAVLKAMINTDGSILEFQGDCVIGVWPPGIAGPDHARKAIAAARALLDEAPRVAPNTPEVPIGIGVHTGTAYVGTVMAANSDIQEISAFGLDVNLTARLSASASAGEAVISEAACKAAGVGDEKAPLRSYTLKGIDEPVEARVFA